ncbi:MAG TPA: hypothetical protein VH186_32465 [Chloroflexia bacterium]|nr:hypothetical protein [Chloroflexia bacterium]
MIFVEDYIDEDVAYLLGMIAAKGSLSESGGQKQIVIEFPFVNLSVEGISSSFDQETAITVGLVGIQKRLQELLETSIDIVDKPNSKELVARFQRKNMMWRNIITLTGGSTTHHTFQIPEIMFNPALPTDYKREFIKGYGDVAGNIRASNNFMNEVNRVRLDVMNANWKLPVQLCLLLQNEIGVSVQMVQWGHPNTRGKKGNPFKEHQIQIFAKEYGKVGFNFPHKQKILEEFIEADFRNEPNFNYKGCPGRKILKTSKEVDPKENDSNLPVELKGKHFNSYWQICKELGCTREPASNGQLSLLDLAIAEDDNNLPIEE